MATPPPLDRLFLARILIPSRSLMSFNSFSRILLSRNHVSVSMAAWRPSLEKLSSNDIILRGRERALAVIIFMSLYWPVLLGTVIQLIFSELSRTSEKTELRSSSFGYIKFSEFSGAVVFVLRGSSSSAWLLRKICPESHSALLDADLQAADSSYLFLSPQRGRGSSLSVLLAGGSATSFSL